MMKQYLQIKEQHKDCILFFRLGDFYEMFFDDAKLVSKELELTLTGRDCGQEERAPMCGVPYHSCESYIARLISKGYKVAICEQMEDPATAKGLVKRDIVRIITPGTVMESSMLDESKNNYISCCYVDGSAIGVCFTDISTGELHCTLISGKDYVESLKNELFRFSPKEILIGGDVGGLDGIQSLIRDKLSAGVEMLEDEKFNFDNAFTVIKEQFGGVQSQQLFEQGGAALVSSLGALIDYLRSTQINGLERINKIDFYLENQYMNIDYSTRRNLELLETMRSKDKKGSLLWVLDKTKTAMGKRLIRTWIEKPLVSCAAIIKRQNAVDELYSNTVMRLELVNALGGISDIERLMTRIVYGTANGRELRNLAAALKVIPEVISILKDVKAPLLVQLLRAIDPLEDVASLIESSIVEDPPFSVREGGIICDGYNEELDTVRNDMNNSASYLTQIEVREREKTSIPKLKVGYNRVFGYYIEVSNSYKNLVPEEYIRKQTLSNCERYITQELKNLEGRILGARERSQALEYKIFEEIRSKVAANLDRIQQTATSIANLDVLASLAGVAADNRYCKPNISLSGGIRLKESRHPVVEQLLSGTPFVPNDAVLDSGDNTVAIITGPNMAGKSTYMRQVALIVLMAQIGSFVPAAAADIEICDSIFTRVGASDDLAAGQSTFMVEMSEVAHIVKNATSKSLLVLDEIGRGTSTFDGMSIARAVLEYVANKKKLGAKTLFATHYHELSVMEDVLDGVKNYNIAVKKRGDDITFLRRIVPGGADDSYGIEVAKLAGVPDWIIKRAKQILKELESGNAQTEKTKSVADESNNADNQLSLFSAGGSAVEEKLKSIDINTLTPIESMNILFELINMCQ